MIFAKNLKLRGSHGVYSAEEVSAEAGVRQSVVVVIVDVCVSCHSWELDLLQISV